MELVYSIKVFDLVERDGLFQTDDQPVPMDDNYTSLEWFQTMLDTLPDDSEERSKSLRGANFVRKDTPSSVN
ncbi:hypothetical protein QQX98_009443 [Neonectria punicea]|uniref:Uncharacterized protein n=1 Tax=Neonectria punicea TaxID=979145 RepID=A0ABR1GSE9_9HYPO